MNRPGVFRYPLCGGAPRNAPFGIIQEKTEDNFPISPTGSKCQTAPKA
jgi:hypothetical protein